MKPTLYSVEFILNVQGVSLDSLKDSLKDLGEDLEMTQQHTDERNPEGLKVHIHTAQPHAVFDACSLFGKLNYIKVDNL